MSRPLRIVFVATLLAGACADAGSAANIISRPAGFVRFDLAPESQTLVSLPLEPFSSDANSLFAGQLAPNDRILTWDAARQVYGSSSKTGDSWDSSVTLSPGQAFWIENHQPTGQTVYLFGRVVMDEQVSMNFLPALNLYGFPYTTASGEWLLGQGYWFDNLQTQAVPWAVSRPYDDIFNVLHEAPSIEGLTIVSGGVNLSINSAGLEGAALAIMYQDLAPTGVLNTTRGWLIAEQGIQAHADNLNWTDNGDSHRPAPLEVFARLYLVVRAGLDANGNGVADIFEGGSFGQIGALSVSTPASGAADSSATDAGVADNNLQSTGQEPASTNSASPGFVIYYEQPVVYVDAACGDDSYSGKRPAHAGVDGPKRTIRAGLAAATEQGTVVIRDGAYGENLNIAGRSVDVRIEGNVDLSGAPRSAPQPSEPPSIFTNSAGQVERTQP